jgi:16S rRNA (guanine527-N7)-methyltransferase
MTHSYTARLADERIQKALEPFGIGVSTTLAERIRRYTELLLCWNRRVNLTSITDPVEIVQRHFGESLFAAHAVPIERGRLADVGSGAGFPGLALRVLLEDLRVTLIEPTTKKCVFLAEVCRELDLLDVVVFRGSMREMPAEGTPFDYVTARALGRQEELLKWSEKALRPTGLIVLWVGSEDAKKLSLSESWLWQEPVPIPLSRNRALLAGQPKPCR